MSSLQRVLRSRAQWQSDADLHYRRHMVKVILNILVSGTEPRAVGGIRSVIVVAKQVELDLYKRAQDFDAYSDASTIKKRVLESIQLSQNSCAFSWRSDKDFTVRRRMIKLITMFLKKELQVPDSSDSTKFIFIVAKHVEASMYRNAPCFAVYADERTVEIRLRSMQVSLLNN